MARKINEVPCASCGERRLRLSGKLVARPLGSHSLAGVQAKVSARKATWMSCDGCGANGEVSITKREHSDTYDLKVLTWSGDLRA